MSDQSQPSQTQQDLAADDARAFLAGNNLPGGAVPPPDRLSLHTPAARWTFIAIGTLLVLFFVVLIGTLLPFLLHPGTSQPPAPTTTTSPSQFFSNSANPNTQIQQNEKTCANAINAALNC